MKIVQKAWGWEEHIVNESYCGKRMVLHKGFQSSMHYHMIKDEVLFVERGRVRFELEGETREMTAGQMVRVLPRQKHRFAGLENSIMFEFSTHDDAEDNYRLTQSGPIE